MKRTTRISEFVFGVGIMAKKSDVVGMLSPEAIEGLECIEGKYVTTFAACDEAGIQRVLELVGMLTKWNREAAEGYVLPFSQSLAVPVIQHTSEPVLEHGVVVRSSFTSRRGIPTTTRFDERLKKAVLTTPTFWRIDLAIDVASGKKTFKVKKFGCKPMADKSGFLEWKPIHKSETKGGEAVEFVFDGEDAVAQVVKTTRVNEKFLNDQVEEAEAAMPKTEWQKKFAEHAMSLGMGRVVAEAESPALTE